MTPDYWSDAIAALSAADPVMARLIGAYPAEALVSRDDPFGTLARSIVGQQISVVPRRACGRASNGNSARSPRRPSGRPPTTAFSAAVFHGKKPVI